MAVRRSTENTRDIPLYNVVSSKIYEKEALSLKPNVDESTVCVVGLGYVGLPLAETFAQSLWVIGFDIKSDRIAELNHNNNNRKLIFTTDANKIAKADFIIICVPTPVTESKEPDLIPVESAATTVGQNIKKGSIIILESTVYPGVTEEIVKPILEKESGLRCGEDFKIAYSPERVNPGDREHTIDRITKVVAGMDEETTELVAELYSKVAHKVFKAKDIKTAEAAKVIENIQRDLNIALMNELSLIFERLHLDTKEVLDAAATKWNFQRYSPGLVGGHCIPVDPYYLVSKARELGYHSQVILAGRAINDYMAKHVAEMTIKALNDAGKVIKESKILIMGLTYKENVPDTRETPVKEVIKELKEYGVDTFGYDPVLPNAEDEFGIKILKSLKQEIKFDGIILAVAHDAFKENGKISLDGLKAIANRRPVLIDIRRCLDGSKALEKGFYYRTL
jgi:UDPglucose 6-dehydrogenase/UDP-N-acetyl-D-galactosamine dehydrogenase